MPQTVKQDQHIAGVLYEALPPIRSLAAHVAFRERQQRTIVDREIEQLEIAGEADSSEPCVRIRNPELRTCNFQSSNHSMTESLLLDAIKLRLGSDEECAIGDGIRGERAWFEGIASDFDELGTRLDDNRVTLFALEIDLAIRKRW